MVVDEPVKVQYVLGFDQHGVWSMVDIGSNVCVIKGRNVCESGKLDPRREDCIIQDRTRSKFHDFSEDTF